MGVCLGESLVDRQGFDPADRWEISGESIALSKGVAMSANPVPELTARAPALVVVLAVVLAISCASTRQSPVLDHRDAEFTTTAVPGQSAAVAADALRDGTETVQASDEAPGGGTPSGNLIAGSIKLVNWNDKRISLENHIAGYIMVHGYGYPVEILEVEDSDAYEDALAQGEGHVVLEMSKAASPDWYKTHTESGTIIDIGTIFDDKTDLRIGVHTSFGQTVPDLVAFLQRMNPGDQLVEDLAAQIVTGGRAAIGPNVIALKFLKNHEDVWTQWVATEVADRVRGAIESRKTSLRDRPCVPLGKGGYSDFHLKGCWAE